MAERRTLATERDQLRDEQRSLMRAHYAGAAPLDLLKEEQDRLSRRLAFVDARIDAGQVEYDQAKGHLEDCLTLAGNAHAIYMSIDDSLRRIANQAFFEHIHIYEVTPRTDAATADHGEPFDILFNPELQAVAVDQEARLQAGLPLDPEQVKGLNIEHLVGVTGIEPVTSSV